MPEKKLSPIIQALVDELPADTQWAKDKQQAWLKMMTMAFDVVYGGEAKPDAPASAPTAKSVVIDERGMVRFHDGERLNRNDVTGMTIVDLRGAEGDLRAIIWADDSTGVDGVDCQIVT